MFGSIFGSLVEKGSIFSRLNRKKILFLAPNVAVDGNNEEFNEKPTVVYPVDFPTKIYTIGAKRVKPQHDHGQRVSAMQAKRTSELLCCVDTPLLHQQQSKKESQTHIPYLPPLRT